MVEQIPLDRLFQCVLIHFLLESPDHFDALLDDFPVKVRFETIEFLEDFQRSHQIIVRNRIQRFQILMETIEFETEHGMLDSCFCSSASSILIRLRLSPSSSLSCRYRSELAAGS